MSLECGARKCFSKNVGNLMDGRNWQQSEHLMFVEFTDEMLFQLKMFVPATYLGTGHHGATGCIVFVHDSWWQCNFWQHEANE